MTPSSRAAHRHGRRLRQIGRRPSPPTAFARPKSSTFTTPSGVILMFAGFRSRWMIPFSWAASSASAICRAMASASRTAARACASRAIGERLRERLAVHQLENQEPDAVGFFEPVDRADVRMVQRGEHPRLALEAREPIRVARERARQDLDRDVASELRVARPVHLAHAAGAEQRLEVISAEGSTGHRRQVADDVAGMRARVWRGIPRRTPARSAAIRHRAAAPRPRDRPPRETPRGRSGERASANTCPSLGYVARSSQVSQRLPD